MWSAYLLLFHYGIYMEKEKVCGSSFGLIWFGLSYFVQEQAIYIGTMCDFFGKQLCHQENFIDFFAFN